MIIGVDLRALQTGHRYRGIGEVTKQVTNRVLELAANEKNPPSFIFYEYNDDDPKELISIPNGLAYEVVKVGLMPENNTTATKSEKLRRNAIELYGEPIKDSHRADVFLQFDYAFGVPANTKTVLIKHDLIPYIFWDTFFESAWVPFKNLAVRTTLRTLFANYRFLRILGRSLKRANVIVSVSESTKRDLAKLFKVRNDKIKVAKLGVSIKPAKTNNVSAVQRAFLPTKPYLLFVGAGDARRRVEDLVGAYNNLKADGHDIQLVLVGENFKAKHHIPTKNVRDAVLSSSYGNDILTLGYVDDATKQQLFKGAIAFVYPTKYEGFGIPILESMLLECPVITYKNSSIPEVASEYALYAHNWSEIKLHVESLLTMKPAARRKLIGDAKAHAKQFSWDKTAEIIYNELNIIVRGK
jgi:glycosyltransferase involved in cell wall biosynthesis